LRLANGEFANIDAINDRRVLLRLDNGRQLSAMLERLRHIDYGYASTSHSAQGATVDRVIVDIDTRLSPELVNRKQFYVSISRARNALAIYTDNRGQLQHAINRGREKSLAREHSVNAFRPGFAILPDAHHHIVDRGRTLRR
jgi:ATP-dependent exoDNAse (exonuclease V) alpha subunit